MLIPPNGCLVLSFASIPIYRVTGQVSQALVDGSGGHAVAAVHAGAGEGRRHQVARVRAAAAPTYAEQLLLGLVSGNALLMSDGCVPLGLVWLHVP